MTMHEIRAAIELHLAKVEALVIIGTRHVERQRRTIADLERDAPDAGLAKELLTTFEETLALHVRGRNRLRKELDKFSSA